MTPVRLARHRPTGRAVAVKRATEPEDEDRLRHEAAILEAARHPRVVELVGLDRGEDGLELSTTFVSGRTLTDLLGGELSIPEIAIIVGDLAVTLADLHERGIVHGRVDPSHVVVGHDGRPVLCGFSAARSASSDASLDGAIDLEALARILESLLPAARSETPGNGVDAATAAVLQSVAARATSGTPAPRASLRKMAATIRAAVPDARWPEPGPEPGPEPDRKPPTPESTAPRQARPRARLAVAPSALRAARGVGSVGVGLILLAAALVAAGDNGHRLPFDEPDLAPPASAPSSAPPPVASDPHRRAAPDRPMPVLEAGGVVRLGASRFVVGEPGDIVLLADWSCRGVVLPALVRPATGAVFVFPTWPARDDAITVSPVARAGPASGAGAVTGPTGCPALRIDTDDGRRVVIEP